MSLTIVQGVVFLLYISFILIKFGVLPSISDSWYKLQALGGVWYSLFTWFCFILGFLMFFQTDGSSPFFFITSGSGLVAVGVCTLFKATKSLEPYIHFGGALLGIMGALLGIGFERHAFLPLIVFGILTLIFEGIRIKNTTWWVEISAFICIILGLLVY